MVKKSFEITGPLPRETSKFASISFINDDANSPEKSFYHDDSMERSSIHTSNAYSRGNLQSRNNHKFITDRGLSHDAGR